MMRLLGVGCMAFVPLMALGVDGVAQGDICRHKLLKTFVTVVDVKDAEEVTVKEAEVTVEGVTEMEGTPKENSPDFTVKKADLEMRAFQKGERIKINIPEDYTPSKEEPSVEELRKFQGLEGTVIEDVFGKDAVRVQLDVSTVANQQPVDSAFPAGTVQKVQVVQNVQETSKALFYAKWVATCGATLGAAFLGGRYVVTPAFRAIRKRMVAAESAASEAKVATDGDVKTEAPEGEQAKTAVAGAPASESLVIGDIEDVSPSSSSGFFAKLFVGVVVLLSVVVGVVRRSAVNADDDDEDSETEEGAETETEKLADC